MRLLHSGKFSDKKILLIDKNAKNTNDRTWCFWEDGAGFFENIVYKKWDTVSFFGDDFTKDLQIAPYQYKMIRGADFYNYCFTEIKKHSNVEIVQASVQSWQYENDDIVFIIDDNRYTLRNEKTEIFNSFYTPDEPHSDKTITLLQHFKGWLIETAKPSFTPDRATLMDFRVHQQHGTTFAYVLPFSETKALVEYTLFTKQLLAKEKYDIELGNYMRTILEVSDYTILDEEFGVIPMTNKRFSFNGKGRQIGTAGGQTKASTGYTFQFIQKQSAQIAASLLQNIALDSLSFSSPARFRFYDNTLLDILYNNTLPGKKIFSQLFKKNNPQSILRFLDNESSLPEELKIISSLPAWPFLKAAMRQL